MYQLSATMSRFDAEQTAWDGWGNVEEGPEGLAERRLSDRG
jgi:hypothetical protein